jgi:hypothetical protein
MQKDWHTATKPLKKKILKNSIGFKTTPNILILDQLKKLPKRLPVLEES